MRSGLLHLTKILIEKFQVKEISEISTRPSLKSTASHTGSIDTTVQGLLLAGPILQEPPYLPFECLGTGDHDQVIPLK